MSTSCGNMQRRGRIDTGSTGCGHNPAEIRAMLELPRDGLLRVRCPVELAAEAGQRADSAGLSLAEYVRRAVVAALVAQEIREDATRVRLAGERELAAGQTRMRQAVIDGKLRLARMLGGDGE